MITVNNINIPSEWDELNTTQYIAVIKVLQESFSGEIDIESVRYKILKAITGYVPSKKKLKLEIIEEINSNLKIIYDKIRFPFCYEYAEVENYIALGMEARLFLHKYLPTECYCPKLSREIQSALPLTPSIKFDIRWRKNPLPEFVWCGKKYYGPKINIDTFGILDTDITAGTWVDAQSYYNLFLETKDENFLLNLAALFYFDKNKQPVQSAPKWVILTCYLLMYNLLDYLVKRSAYSVLFNRRHTSDGDKDKISLGAQATIYDLVKAGYGTNEEIRSESLVEFLNMQIDKLKTLIAECRGLKMKDSDIHLKFNIPYEAIKNL